MPGHPDWQGTALTHGIDILANGFGVTIGPGQTIAFPGFTITRPGYLLNVEAEWQSSSGNEPTWILDLGWYDQGQNVHFGHEMWQMPNGTPGNGYFHTGRGPTKGQLLVLSFTNDDASDTLVATFWLAQTTQHASRDDIRLHALGTNFTFANVPGANPTFNILADLNAVTIGAGVTTTWLLPMYSGSAGIFWEATGQSAANVLTATVVPTDLGNHAPVWQQSASATPFVGTLGQLLVMPRKCCLLQLKNNGSSTATVSLSLTAQEYTS